MEAGQNRDKKLKISLARQESYSAGKLGNPAESVTIFQQASGTLGMIIRSSAF